jgi:hypothetical protein
METSQEHSKKRKVVQTSPSNSPTSFESGLPYQRKLLQLDQADGPLTARKQRDSMVFHPVPHQSTILPRWGMSYPPGYPVQSFPSPEITENCEIQESHQQSPIPRSNHWSQFVAEVTVGSKGWPSSHVTSAAMEQGLDHSLAMFANSDSQPGPGLFSTPTNAMYNLLEVSSCSDIMNSSTGKALISIDRFIS